MTQLSFDLPFRTARGRDDFFVSAANTMAVAMIEDMDHWPQGKLMIIGPKGAGKTHLLDIWAQDNNAQFWAPDWRDLPDPGAAIAIDNVDTFAQDRDAQTALFHVHNHLAATNGRLLMASSTAIAQADFTLPDLGSRLQATTTAQISPPDDTLMQAVIHKHFSDRQIFPTPSAVAYLTKNIDRSFEAISQAIAQLDHQSLTQGRKITRTMVKQILDQR